MIVCLDTNIVIYLVEANPVWTPIATVRFNALLAAGDQIAVCDAARLECLVKPLASGNSADEASYRTFFGNPLVKMLPVTPLTWEHAARLGATYTIEMEHLPRHPKETQSPLRMTYWLARMNSLGKKAETSNDPSKVMKKCLELLAKDYPNAQFVYSNEFFGKCK